MALTTQLHVSLVAIPETAISTLAGIYDVLNSVRLLTPFADGAARWPSFRIDVVGETRTAVNLASGLPIQPHRGFEEIEATDILIVPSLLIGDESWVIGRYPGLVRWIDTMHAKGAALCSACSGLFLLAETGLFDGKPATIHWAYADIFRGLFPDVPLAPERALVVAGARETFISSGASTSWNDLVLYLIGRHIGTTAALAAAKFFALQGHSDGLAPYIVFSPPLDHDDAAVRQAQDWLSTHFPIANPVEEMVRHARLPARTFKRRFSAATAYTPIAYVQRLRIEDAKRRLERTREPIDDIGWRVGYEEPAFFRRLFRRLTGVSPGAYRRKFQFMDGTEA
jgi:transcriptional regulator GlxA family with amidase domain